MCNRVIPIFVLAAMACLLTLPAHADTVTLGAAEGVPQLQFGSSVLVFLNTGCLVVNNSRTCDLAGTGSGPVSGSGKYKITAMELELNSPTVSNGVTSYNIFNYGFYTYPGTVTFNTNSVNVAGGFELLSVTQDAGTIVTINFDVNQNGNKSVTGELNFQAGAQLSDPNGGFNANPGAVTGSLNIPSTVPEPSSLLLLSTGLLAAWKRPRKPGQR